MEKTVIQCYLRCRDIAGNKFERWVDLVQPSDCMWEDAISDIVLVQGTAFPQIEVVEIRLKDLKSLQTFTKILVELEEEPQSFGGGMIGIPIGALMNQQNNREPAESGDAPDYPTGMYA